MTLVGALSLSVAAFADVDIDTDIDKDKDIFVDVNIDIDKDVDVDVDVFANPDGAAEADITKNQENHDNNATLDNVDASATIDGSVTGSDGLFQLNQAPGVQNNQGNETAVSASVDLSGGGGAGIFTDAQAHSEQDNFFNTVTAFDTPVVVGPVSGTLTDDILNSFNTGAGVAGVNQSAGSQNNQNNANAVAIGNEALVALSEADIGQDNYNNTANLSLTDHVDTISASFNGFAGVANANQSAGFQNNQANVTAISVNTGVNNGGGAGGGMMGGI